jgi:hypothetical protein
MKGYDVVYSEINLEISDGNHFSAGFTSNKRRYIEIILNHFGIIKFKKLYPNE